GDTIQFTSTNPFRIKVTGRVKFFINAFGEELVTDNADDAIIKASEQTGAQVRHYSAGPIYFENGQKGAHEWFIEFEKHPSDMEVFEELLDKYLQQNNSDYEAKRYKD